LDQKELKPTRKTVSNDACTVNSMMGFDARVAW